MIREEAIAYYKKNAKSMKRMMEISESLKDMFLPSLEAAEMAIKALEQEPKIGHWMLTDDDIFVYCSKCEDSYYQRPIDASWHYCPNCGAKMVEPKESEE